MNILEAWIAKGKIEERSLFQEAERMALIHEGRREEVEEVQCRIDETKAERARLANQGFSFAEIEPIIGFLQELGYQIPTFNVSVVANKEDFKDLRPLIEFLFPFAIFPE